MANTPDRYYPDIAYPAGPYTPATGVGNLVFISGQGTYDRLMGRAYVGDDVEKQLRLALENLRIVLECAGSSMEQIVKLTVYTTRMYLLNEIDSAYTHLLDEPRPARTVIGVAALPNGAMIQLDAIALK